MPDIGVPELLIILAVVVIVFGVGRLPEVGGALGKSIREFRRSVREDGADARPAEPDAPAQAQAARRRH